MLVTVFLLVSSQCNSYLLVVNTIHFGIYSDATNTLLHISNQEFTFNCVGGYTQWLLRLQETYEF